MFDNKEYMKDYNNRPEVKHRYKQRYLDNPNRYKEQRDKWNSYKKRRQIRFKGKQIIIKENPRIGVCNLCRSVVPFDCKITHMHHIEYHKDDPLKDTIEVCPSCHIYSRK